LPPFRTVSAIGPSQYPLSSNHSPVRTLWEEHLLVHRCTFFPHLRIGVLARIMTQPNDFPLPLFRVADPTIAIESSFRPLVILFVRDKVSYASWPLLRHKVPFPHHLHNPLGRLSFFRGIFCGIRQEFSLIFFSPSLRIIGMRPTPVRILHPCDLGIVFKYSSGLLFPGPFISFLIPTPIPISY